MEDNELRNRISKADAFATTESLNETVVAQAPLRKRRSGIGFRAARWSLAGAAAAVLAVGITLPQALAPRPLFEVAGQSGNQAANMTGAMPESADASLSKDMGMIWPGWIEYNYIPQGLSDQPGSGEIYQIRRVGNPEQLLAKVAEAFGIAGAEPREDEWSTAEFPSWSISGEDYNVNVWWSGPGGWSFSRWSNSWVGCAEPGTVDDSGSSEGTTESARDLCQEDVYQPTPELVPSEVEMISIAAGIFAQLGTDFDPAQARVWRDDWGGSVSIPLTLDGTPIPLEAYIGWDGKGQLSYASGYSIEIVSRGTFDTISPLAAVDRISDWRWFGSASSSYYEELYASQPQIARSNEASSPASDSVVEGDIAIDEPAVMPAPEEPLEPEIVDVIIDRSVSALLGLYDANGDMWLVPGYLLYNDQGWFDSIVAVEEGVIALPEPVEIMPMPMIDEPAIEVEPAEGD